MTVSFEIPGELEHDLRKDFPNIDAEAKEAFLVALYRCGKLSRLSLSRALGIDRVETESVLLKHHVTEDLGTIDDYLQDARALEELRNSRR